ncbi:glucosamine-6-phosphate deaminase [soil metagenome]
MESEILVQPKMLSHEKVPVVIYKNSKEASKVVAREIADFIIAAQQNGKNAVLGLATGSTPKKVYAELISLHRNEGLSFKNVISFNLDEYYTLTPDAIQSYRRFMHENLFDHIDILPENCFIPEGTVPQELLKTYCTEYENKIAEAGGIDIQLLGIGSNGHIGFNEPGSHISSPTRLITLDLSTRADASSDFGGIANVPKKAITMGVGTILKAKRIILLVWGERKAEILKKTVEGPVTEFVPASYLQGHPNTLFVTEQSAAAALTRRKSPWLTENVVWDTAMIKKAVTSLALTVKKPILKLTDNDYNENGLSDLLAMYGQAYDINIKVFNWLQYTITGWPGGKPNADDTNRPERANPAKKRVLIFSPHPDDDIISMGGTFQRLVDQGHEVHVAYQTSGNIAVADDEALRFTEFVVDFNEKFSIENNDTTAIYKKALAFLKVKESGEKDIEEVRYVKGLIRRGEARNTCRFVGIPAECIHFLDLPFYETGLVEKSPLSQKDYATVQQVIQQVQPHQLYAAGDLADPHGTHKVCLDAIFESVHFLKNEAFMKDCWVWLYKGAWAEWDIDMIEMAVPMSPDQVLKKRLGIFKHQSQKDGVVYQGTDSREFWQRAEERNKATADLYNKLGLAEYAAMEAFVRWNF